MAGLGVRADMSMMGVSSPGGTKLNPDPVVSSRRRAAAGVSKTSLTGSVVMVYVVPYTMLCIWQ